MGDRGCRQPGGDRCALRIAHAVRDRGFVYMVLHPAVLHYEGSRITNPGRVFFSTAKFTKGTQKNNKIWCFFVSLILCGERMTQEPITNFIIVENPVIFYLPR